MKSVVQESDAGEIDYHVAGNILHPKGQVPCAIYTATERHSALHLSGNIRELVH
jgi:hypothetical protein